MKKKKYVIQDFVMEPTDRNRYYRNMDTKDFIPLLGINQYLEKKV